MMKIKIILFSTAALTLSSCGLYNRYQPETTVPDQIAGAVPTTDTVSATLPAWEKFFADAPLRALIRQALENNADYLTAGLRVDQAEATLKASKLAFLPAFALSPQGTLSSFDGAKASPGYTLPVSASWQIDLFGAMLNNKRKSDAAARQAAAYEQAVKTRLIASVANTYYTLLMLDAQYAISLETQTKWEESVRVARALKEAGMYTEAGVAQTEATYYAISTSIEDLKEQINQTQNALALILAETPRAYDRTSLDEQVFADPFATGIPVALLANRPDVSGAEQTLAAAFYGVNQARAAFYPSLTLSGSAGWTNNLGQMIVNPGKLIASAVGSLTAPLFTNGQNRARLKIARSQQQEAELGFRQTLLNAGSEVNNAFTQCQTARRKTELIDRQIDALQAAVKSTELLMQHGSTNYLEVLTAHQSLLSARLDQTANRFAEIRSIINLYQALGGGK